MRITVANPLRFRACSVFTVPITAASDGQVQTTRRTARRRRSAADQLSRRVQMNFVRANRLSIHLSHRRIALGVAARPLAATAPNLYVNSHVVGPSTGVSSGARPGCQSLEPAHDGAWPPRETPNCARSTMQRLATAFPGRRRTRRRRLGRSLTPTRRRLRRDLSP